MTRVSLPWLMKLPGRNLRQLSPFGGSVFRQIRGIHRKGLSTFTIFKCLQLKIIFQRDIFGGRAFCYPSHALNCQEPCFLMLLSFEILFAVCFSLKKFISSKGEFLLTIITSLYIIGSLKSQITALKIMFMLPELILYDVEINEDHPKNKHSHSEPAICKGVSHHHLCIAESQRQGGESFIVVKREG